MELPRPYARPLTTAALPAEIRAELADTPLQEPPAQGRTSRVAFAWDRSGQPVVLKRSAGPHLELLRREYRALCAVHPLDVRAPEPLSFFERPTPAGPEGWLVTRRLRGVPLAAALRAGPDRAPLLTEFGRTLARLHATPPPPGLGSGDWLEHLLRVAHRLNPSVSAASCERVRTRRPPAALPVLIHGDLFPDNVMTADGRVTGFIDWGFADVGDPRADLAVATHGWTRGDREAFAAGYGAAARLTDQEAAYFVEVALLF